MARHEVPDTRDKLEYVALRALFKIFEYPSLAMSRRMGRGLGYFAARVIPLRKRVALENLQFAFPDLKPKEREKIYREMCGILGITLADLARLGRSHLEPMSQVCGLKNHQAIGAALSGGKGALILSAHFGSWENISTAIADAGYPTTILAGRQRNPLVEGLFTRLRARRNVGSIVVGKSLRPVVEAFKRGECVASGADQDGGRDGFFMDFLGRRASVQSGLFRLIARRGVPMVVGFVVRKDGEWIGHIHDPELPRPVTTKEDAEVEAQRLARVYTNLVEDYIRRHPEHWFWVHRRWKTRPPVVDRPLLEASPDPRES